MKKNFLLPVLLLLIVGFFSCEKNDQKPNTDKNIKGCGDFVVGKIISADQVLTIWIDRNKIAFSKDFQTFENIAAEDFASVKIEQNCEIDVVWFNLCNDVLDHSSCASIHWTLQSGKLSFKVSEVPTGTSCSNFYLATVHLEQAVFKNDSSGETQTLDSVELNNVQVGWCAG